jgi:hypothetical protein
VSDRVVDNQGIVQTTPRSGTSVTLSGSGSWAVRTSNPAVTDATGTATFRLVCRAEGDQSLSVVLDGSDVQALNVPGCVPPPTTTTSGAPGSTTTTTSGR